MYTQGTDYTTGATTSTNYTTSQYQYQYQYQMPTTTTTTTTQQYTTTTPVTYSTQQYTVPEFTQTYTTTAVPTTVTTSIPTTVTTSVPTYTTTIPSTVTTTTSVPTYTTTQYTTTSASQYASPVLPAPVKPQPPRGHSRDLRHRDRVQPQYELLFHPLWRGRHRPPVIRGMAHQHIHGQQSPFPQPRTADWPGLGREYPFGADPPHRYHLGDEG